MIVGADIDRCIVAPFEAELSGLTVSEAKAELRSTKEMIGEAQAWIRALEAWVRLIS